MTERRRAVVLCRPDTPGREIGHLAMQYGLDVVYRVFVETETSKLTALIAGQHLAEYDAVVLVIPYLTVARIRHQQYWWAVLTAADVIASDGPIDYPSTGRTRQGTFRAP